MSLIMPVMINNKTIGALVIRRTEDLRDGETHHYEWELGMNGRRDLRQDRAPENYTGTVLHRYDDGAVELLKKVFAQL